MRVPGGGGVATHGAPTEPHDLTLTSSAVVNKSAADVVDGPPIHVPTNISGRQPHPSAGALVASASSIPTASPVPAEACVARGDPLTPTTSASVFGAATISASSGAEGVMGEVDEDVWEDGWSGTLRHQVMPAVSSKPMHSAAASWADGRVLAICPFVRTPEEIICLR